MLGNLTNWPPIDKYAQMALDAQTKHRLSFEQLHELARYLATVKANNDDHLRQYAAKWCKEHRDG